MKEKETIEVDDFNSSLNETNTTTLRVSALSSTEIIKTIKMSIYEVFLLIWIICMIAEEIKQVTLISFTI